MASEARSPRSEPLLGEEGVVLRVCGFRVSVFPGVYRPSDDSYLLFDSLSSLPRGLALDVGTGSGLIALGLAGLGSRVLALDSSRDACRNALLNAEANGLADRIDALASDLFSGIRPRAALDAVVFNPPYLPVEGEDASWSGGAGGRMVIDRFLQDVAGHLRPGGRILTVQSSLSGIEETVTLMERLGFRVTRASSRRFTFEELVVLLAELRGNPQEL